MSLPRELQDQLLTGYLDDTLSTDELVRVEQLLQTDDEFVQELAGLQEIRRSLKLMAEVDADVRLDDGFASRVLDAAVSRARSEGLGDDHPLIRLTEEPSAAPIQTSPQSSGFSWWHASLVVGLAASIVIAVIVLRPPGPVDPNSGDGDGTLALVDSENAATGSVPAAPDDDSISDTLDLADGGNDASSDTVEADLGPTAPMDDALVPSNAGVSPDAIASDTATKIEPAQPVVPASSNPVTPSTDESTVPQTQIGAILVFDVRQTEVGRAADAVGDAMKYAELDPASQQPITAEIAGLVSDQTESAGDRAALSIMYLQAPAKNLDRFFLRLVADQEGIQSVGMIFAVDAKIIKLVDAVCPDPASIRHQDVSLELFGDNPIVDALAGQLDELEYKSLSRESPAAISASGPDIRSQILVLVR